MGKSSNKKRPALVEQSRFNKEKKHKKEESSNVHKQQESKYVFLQSDISLKDKEWEIVKKSDLLPKERIVLVLAVFVECYARNNMAVVSAQEIFDILKLFHTEWFTKGSIYNDLAKLNDYKLIEKCKDNRLNYYKLADNFKKIFNQFEIEYGKYEGFKSLIKQFKAVFELLDLNHTDATGLTPVSEKAEFFLRPIPGVAEWQVVINKGLFPSDIIIKVFGIMIENYLCNANRKRKIEEILGYLELMTYKGILTKELLEKTSMRKLIELGLVEKVQGENEYSLTSDFIQTLKKMPINSEECARYKDTFELVVGFYPGSELYGHIHPPVSNKAQLNISPLFWEASRPSALQAPIAYPYFPNMGQSLYAPMMYPVSQAYRSDMFGWPVMQQPTMVITYPGFNSVSSLFWDVNSSSALNMGQPAYVPMTSVASQVYTVNHPVQQLGQLSPVTLTRNVLGPSSRTVSAEFQNNSAEPYSISDDDEFINMLNGDQVSESEETPTQIRSQQDVIEPEDFSSVSIEEILQQLPEESLTLMQETIMRVQSSVSLSKNRYSSFSDGTIAPVPNVFPAASRSIS